MRKIHSLLAAACLLAASCNKEEIQSETDKAGMYHITVAVTGSFHSFAISRNSGMSI